MPKSSSYGHRVMSQRLRKGRQIDFISYLAKKNRWDISRIHVGGCWSGLAIRPQQFGVRFYMKSGRASRDSVWEGAAICYACEQLKIRGFCGKWDVYKQFDIWVDDGIRKFVLDSFECARKQDEEGAGIVDSNSEMH